MLRLANISESVIHLKELARMLHCAAYNVLIAVISSTQSEIKFYNGFIFPADNLAKVWQVIGCNNFVFSLRNAVRLITGNFY